MQGSHCGLALNGNYVVQIGRAQKSNCKRFKHRPNTANREKTTKSTVMEIKKKERK